jgi:hypothetical protein
MNNNSGGRRIISGQRRRPDTQRSEGRERAQAPRRQTSSGSSGGGWGGLPTSGGGSGSRLPLGKGCLTGVGGIVFLIIIVLILALVVCPGGSGMNCSDLITSPDLYQPDDAYSPGASSGGQLAGQPSAAGFITNYSSASGSSNSSSGRTWLVMLYQDADDSVLEEDIYIDLNEAEKAGSTSPVNIVAQMDRYRGAYSGDGNWTGTKRFLLSQDDNLGKLNSRQIADIGEANMASGQTLVDFVTWAIKSYPADKYALILSDHGMGWPGGWSDPTAQDGRSNIPLESQLGDKLYLHELDDALGQIRSQTGLDKFELIGLDACLMGQLEVFTALEPYARYAVASEETEPSVGWAYTDFLQKLNQNPGMDGAQLGRLIVESYIEDDQRIADRLSLEDLLSAGSPLEGLYGSSEFASSGQMALQMGQSSTLAAVDLSKINALNSSLNGLVFKFQAASQRDIASSRTYAQSYTSIFGSQVPPSYIDLGNFLQIVKQKVGSSAVVQAADEALAALRQAVIAEKHGAQLPGSTGMAIYFPNSRLYQNAITGAESYTAIANRFAQQSLWDDFMAYHYTGEEFSLGSSQAVLPSRAVSAPAAGGIAVSSVTFSSRSVAIGEYVTLEAVIDGENIGYIYLFTGYYDQDSNSVFIADQDYIDPDKIREVNGVYYPDWGRGGFTLQFDWEPFYYAIDDGNTRVPALFSPESYGHSRSEAVYSVEGTYTYSASGEQYPARLYFINGLLRQVYALTGGSAARAPREITPGTGDTFTVTETWLELDSNKIVTQQGATLTFGDRMFTWKAVDAPAGEYMVGFVVEDLDGNQQQALTQITVQ